MNFDKILIELCWRLEDGTPDFNNPKHLQELKVVLTMHKWTTPAINELIETLTEANYVNNAQNRKLGRVGKEWGSSPGGSPKKSKGEPEDAEPEDGKVEKEPKADDSGKSNPKKKIPGMSLESINEIDGDAKDGLFTGDTTAPGTPASAMNEIGTGYGMSILNESPDMSQKEVMEAVQKIITEKGGPKLSKNHLQSIANSAKREHTRVHNHMESTGMNPETTKVSHIWGAKESLAATVNKLKELKKQGVTEVNGIEIDDYMEIVAGGGGGGDPTDTMIMMVDDSQKPPKVEILHTSNKMTSADIQSNSSPSRSLNKMDEKIDSSDMSDKEKASAKSETAKVRKKIEENEKEIKRVIGAQSDKFNNTLEDDESAQRMVDSLFGEGPVEVTTSKSNPDKYWKNGVMTNPAVKAEMKKKYGKDWKNKLTDEDKIQMVRTYAKDIQKKVQNGEEITKNDQRILISFAEGEGEINGSGKKTDPEFAESDINKLYQEQFNSMNNMRKTLNENHDGMGDKMFKSEMISRMHLDVVEGHNPGSSDKSPGIPEENFELNMGRNDSSIKYNKKTGEMYQYTNKPKGKGKKSYKKIDPETGKIKLENGKEVIAKTSEVDEGDTATIANPEIIAECITGKKPPLKKGTLQNNMKVDEKIETEIDVDGKKRQTSYVVYDLDGNEVCKQTVRPKGGFGSNPQDTIEWSDNMQSCMQRKSYLKAKGG